MIKLAPKLRVISCFISRLIVACGTGRFSIYSYRPYPRKEPLHLVGVLSFLEVLPC
jgi:hypothetical protein